MFSLAESLSLPTLIFLDSNSILRGTRSKGGGLVPGTSFEMNREGGLVFELDNGHNI